GPRVIQRQPAARRDRAPDDALRRRGSGGGGSHEDRPTSAGVSVRPQRDRHPDRGRWAEREPARNARASRCASHRGRRVRGVFIVSTATLDRSFVERLVREALQGTLSNGHAGNGKAPAKPKLVVNVSARHCHVTQHDLETLFGPGHQLTPYKWLYQDGFFAAEESVTIIGPRHRMIPNLRILGPCRDHSQVELAFTDAVMLGLDVPVRKSGDHRDSPGSYL